jgi:hypothetical protein
MRIAGRKGSLRRWRKTWEWQSERSKASPFSEIE